MRAAVLHGREDVRVEEVPARPLAEGEVRLRIEAALTCGTDLKVFKRGYHARMIVPPAVFGHELAGAIAELGHGVSGWTLGDRVAVANSAPCGGCAWCAGGQENLCADLLFLNGAYAESIVVPARIVAKNLLRLRPGTAYRDAALVEPLACVVLGMEDVGVRAGQRVLVLGAGPIGLMFLKLARHRGAAVTIVGRSGQRLERASRLGAAQVIAIGADTGIAGAVQGQLADSPDVVIEAVGKPETWEAAVALARKGGVVNFFGGCPAGSTAQLDTGRVHYSSLTLRASFHHTPATIRTALGLIESGVLAAADFVDGDCPLSGLPDLFRAMAAGNRAVKTLIDVRR
jgi:L-iditol 2-dehydrogenase